MKNAVAAMMGGILLVAYTAEAITVAEFDAKYSPKVVQEVLSKMEGATYSTCDHLERERNDVDFTCSEINNCYQALWEWVWGKNPSDCLINFGRSGQGTAKSMYYFVKGYIKLRNDVIKNMN